MATRQSTADLIVEQAAGAGAVSAKRMFGEFGLYCRGRMVALICDERLFVKPTEAGRDYLGTVVEGSPYPRAKPHFLISGERWDDADWLAGLFAVTAEALPEPAPRKPRRKAATPPG